MIDDDEEYPDPAPVASEPLLKWVGGKGQLLGKILPRAPERVRVYVEPFMGGGAVFFALSKRRQPPLVSFLSDANPALVNFYQQVRANPTCLLLELKEQRRLYQGAPQETYAHWASMLNSTRGEGVSQASFFYGLNRCGFNGLWRVNQRGRYNVSWGKEDTLLVPAEDALTEASRALAPAVLRCGDALRLLAETMPLLGESDFVYLDPPYLGTFEGYTANKLGHDALAGLLRELTHRGIPALLSQSDTEETRRVYKGFAGVVVQASRRVNRDGAARGPVDELLLFSQEGVVS